MIDPGLWDSRQFSQLNFMERVLYVGLISNADDDGRLEDRTALIRSKIFPDDDIPLSEIEDALEHLKEVGLIERYTAGEWDIIQHPKWAKYQKINRPSPSKLPPNADNRESFTERSVNTHGTLTERSRPIEVKGKEKKGRGNARAREAESPPKTSDGFSPTQKQITEVKAKYGFSDSTVTLETQKFNEHANGKKPGDKTAAWNLWMLRQWEFIGGPEAEERELLRQAQEDEARVEREVDDAWAEANQMTPEETKEAINQAKITSGWKP